MSVELPPSGTRGFTIPKLARPLAKLGMGVSHLMFRVFGDRMKVQGQPLLKLTTVGAKTGKRRHAVLARLPDPDHPDAWLIVGSGGGSARHPSWCYNLAKNPEQVWVTVQKNEFRVQPESLHGAEREAAWKRVVSGAPGYGRYEETTDRQIPIFRLTPRSE
ncbi:MAG: nitroreductase family deazaflavin-dependent oxidoreductase [Acidimicrobiia bacterium]